MRFPGLPTPHEAASPSARFLLLGWLALVVASAPAVAEAQACPSGNLLANARRVGEGLPAGSEVANDGRAFPEGSPWDTPGAVVVRGSVPVVVYDLGQPTRIRSALLQGDANDAFVLSVSTDGRQFDGVWIAPKVTEPTGGLRLRIASPFDVVARFVRIDVLEGDGLASLSEVQAYCSDTVPDPRPYDVVTAYRTDRSGLHYRTVLGAKAAICFAAVVLLGWLMRQRDPRRAWLAFALGTVLAAFAFTDFLHFHGPRQIVHPTDSLHYFLGPKYFPELGYFDLYTCLAQAERENGRGEALRGPYVRDLRTNRLSPASSLRPLAPRCDGRFSDARWRAFRADVEHYRPLFPPQLPFLRTIADHGYNGTPITTAFHRLFVRDLPVSRASVTAMSTLDMASNLLAVLIVGWGLGPVAGILAGFVIAFGEPWGYQWVGGSIGRANFVLWLAIGIALAGRGRRAASSAALAVSALFRLFPAVFLGVVGLGALAEAVRARRFVKETRGVVLAAVITTVVGVLLAGSLVSFDAFPAFFAVMKRHAQNPPGNHLGLPILLHYQPGLDSASLVDPRLTNPLEVWELRLREIAIERLPLHLLGLGVAAYAVVEAIRRRASQAQLIGFGTLLLFSLSAMTNYDGVWLLAIVPLVADDRRRMSALLAFLGATQVVALLILPMETRCLVQSGLMYALILFVCFDVLRGLPRPEPSSEPLQAMHT